MDYSNVGFVEGGLGNEYLKDRHESREKYFGSRGKNLDP